MVDTGRRGRPLAILSLPTLSSTMRTFHLNALIALLSLSLPSSVCRATEFDLYFLGGQSNMEGFGDVADLPESPHAIVPNVYIFHSTPSADQSPATGNGMWTPLRAGHGTGFRYVEGANVYSDRFGVEMTLARSLADQNPDRKIAFIKYARNGTSIAVDAASRFGCWDPDFRAADGDLRDVNQYDHFLATIRTALDDCDLDDDGATDRLIPRGIVWMQGESDAAATVEIAEAYQGNLKRLMDLIRAALHTDDLPVVIGRISDSGNHPSGKVWKYGDVVRAAQAAFVAEDPAAALVTTTDQYDYSDQWHYDSKGYLDLGKQFADALIKLQRP